MTLRDVPEEIRDVLAAHAAPVGQSLQEYVHGQLTGRPEQEELWGRVHSRLLATGSRVPADVILAAKDVDRP